MASKSTKRLAAEFALAAFVYTLLAFIAFLPGGLGLFHNWIAWFEDPTNCYRIWWIGEVMAGRGESIWELPLLFYPVGVRTMTMSNGIGKELLAAALGGARAPWLAGNLIAFTTPITSALAGFAVLRVALRGAFLPALVGGWMAAYAGYFWAHVVSPWMASTEGYLLFIGCLLYLRRRADWRVSILAGVAVALAVWLQIQFLAHIVVLSGIYVADRLIARDARGAALIVPAAMVGALLSAPLLIETWRTFGGDAELMSGGESDLAMAVYRTRLSSMFLPPEGSLPIGLFSRAAATVLEPLSIKLDLHSNNYLGWTVLALAFVGWRTKHRGTGFLAVVAVTFALLSCGPVISLFSEPLPTTSEEARAMPLFGWSWIPGPFQLIRDLPILGTMRVPGRFMTSAQVALGLLAGFGALRVLRWGYFRRWKAAGAALLLLAHFDINNWPVKLAPRQYSSYWETIAAEPGDFAILDLPYTRGMHQYMHYGAYHHKGVIWGFASRMPSSDFEPVEDDFRFPGILPPFEPELWNPDVPRFARSLLKYRVRYVCFHELHLNYGGMEALKPLRAALIAFWENPDTWAGQDIIEPPKLVHADDVIRVYLIEPAKEAP